MPKKTKKPTKSLSAADTDKYANFLDSLELIAIAAKSCSFHLDRSGYMQFRRATKRPVRVLGEQSQVSSIKEDHFDAEVRFSIGLAAEGAGEGEVEKSLSLECTFEAHFHTGPNPADIVYAERFAESELRVVLRPFARQLIADMTTRMGIAPVFLPLRFR